MPERPAADLRRALATAYDLPAAELDRVANGQSTANHAGTAGGRRVFVKCYPPGTDLAAERQAIQLSEYAAGAGVPTARVLRSRHGDPIHHTGDHALSVWQFVDGESADGRPLTPERLSAAGHAVGHLHRALASHPAAAPALRPGTEVRDLTRATGVLGATLRAYRAIAEPSDFDRWAVEVVRWRLSLVPRLARLLDSLPPLTSQVVHGDLASPNLLYRDGRLAAIIDFRPPRPRPLAWEISRLACDPRTVPHRADWLAGLQRFLTAYRAAGPTATVDDLRATVRVWLCYTATSSYPFDELAGGRALLPENLRTYARDRQDAVVAVLAELDAIEDAVRDSTNVVRIPSP